MLPRPLSAPPRAANTLEMQLWQAEASRMESKEGKCSKKKMLKVLYRMFTAVTYTVKVLTQSRAVSVKVDNCRLLLSAEFNYL